MQTQTIQYTQRKIFVIESLYCVFVYFCMCEDILKGTLSC